MEFVHRFVAGTVPLTILLLHGSGGDETDLLPIGKSLVPGAALLSPRGNVLEHGVRRFFPFPGPNGFDHVEVAARVHELADWLVEAGARYGVEASRLYALGYSNGANMAAGLMLLRPGLVAGACLLRARLAVRADQLPELGGAPVLISAGQSDAIIPAADTELLARTLGDAGAKVDFVMQNAGHDLTPTDFSLVKQWFDKAISFQRSG